MLVRSKHAVGLALVATMTGALLASVNLNCGAVVRDACADTECTDLSGRVEALEEALSQLEVLDARLTSVEMQQQVPPGTVVAFAGSAAPPGWALCDGSALARAEHAALFEVIGTLHGGGDGVSTFNVPDLRGRVAAGKDDMGGVAAGRLTTAGSGIQGTAIGSAGGAESQTLTSAQIPSHTHSPGSLTISGGAHAHTLWLVTPSLTGGSFEVFSRINQSDGVGQTAVDGSHSHTIGGTTGSSGGGEAHSLTQPTLVLTYLIKL